MLARRTFLTAVLATLAAPAFAISTSGGKALVQTVVDQILAVANSAGSKSQAAAGFERMMSTYADMPVISQSVLGPVARSASGAELSAFSKALQGYVARKYGGRFQEFKGGTISVVSSKDRGKFVEVTSKAKPRGRASVNVTFRVWDRSGSPKFIDLIVEGISLVRTERAEIGAMLNKRGGSVAQLTNDLRKLG